MVYHKPTTRILASYVQAQVGDPLLVPFMIGLREVFTIHLLQTKWMELKGYEYVYSNLHQPLKEHLRSMINHVGYYLTMANQRSD